MATIYFVVTFSGHNDPKRSGTRNNAGFAYLAPLLQEGAREVSRFAFFAGLGLTDSNRVAESVLATTRSYFATEYRGRSFSDLRFLIYGASAGGITALSFALKVPDSQIAYIGLADAAFYRGETDQFMTNPGSRAYFGNENFFQTWQNNPDEPEIHGPVKGFTNTDMTNTLTHKEVAGDPHVACIQRAVPICLNSMKAVIRSDRAA
ncbi:MAG: hypothetical protein JNL19_14455 [Burkholderiales bacterium]|nr:hypothetical protein [Burkholderiales bacterium]